MDMERVTETGLVLLGCGKMGSAMLAGWLKQGMSPASVWVIDPAPSDWLRETGVHLNTDLPPAPAAVLIAVKPQMMTKALPQITQMDRAETVFISVAAGTTLAAFEAVLGGDVSIVRAMPNTPAAIGKGITAIVGNAEASEVDLTLAKGLLSAIGQVVRLTSEDQMDAVTGLSGSGPAYVFHLIEAMASAGEKEGLPADLALHLARATVAGAGALAEAAEEGPAELRINVTSPNGTTQAGLKVLMDEAEGLYPLMAQTIAAATERSRELRDE
ncbi:MAG: pyrroline-5-carboxylate reductase [Pseudomonadota bacterium]